MTLKQQESAKHRFLCCKIVAMIPEGFAIALWTPSPPSYKQPNFIVRHRRGLSGRSATSIVASYACSFRLMRSRTQFAPLARVRSLTSRALPEKQLGKIVLREAAFEAKAPPAPTRKPAGLKLSIEWRSQGALRSFRNLNRRKLRLLVSVEKVCFSVGEAKSPMATGQFKSKI